MTDRERVIWEVADRLRAGSTWSEPEVVFDQLRQHSITPTLEELVNVIRLPDRGLLPSYAPLTLARFVAALAAGFGGESILDPRAGIGSLVSELARRLVKSKLAAATGAAPRQLAAVVPLLSGLEQVEWLADDELDQLKQSSRRFDLIVSHPPPIKPYSPEGSQGTTTLAEQVISEAPKLLSEQGIGIFVVLRGLLMVESQRDRLVASLHSAGYRITDIVQVESNDFDGDQFYPSSVIVIRRTTDSRTMAARFSPDPQVQAALVSNIVARREAKRAALGRFVTLDTFRGMSELEAFEAMRELGEKNGFPAITFGQAVSQINQPRRDQDGFEDVANAVYLPLMAKTAASTNQASLPERLKSYLQLVVNPQLVEPEYLAGFLNSPAGQMLRDSVRSGTTIPRIRADLLREAIVHLPPLDLQRQIVEAAGAARRLRQGLAELEAAVWKEPKKIDDTLRSLNRMSGTQGDDGYQTWVDSLPFPLASILWTHSTQKRTTRRRTKSCCISLRRCRNSTP